MGSPVTTYNTLVSACIEGAEDNGSEFLEYLPIAIANAELRLTKELDGLGKVVYTSVTVSASTPLVAKPTAYRLGRAVYLKDTSAGSTTVLRKKTNDYLADYWPVDTSAGTPKYYADWDGDYIRIAPCASVTSLIVFESENKPTALSSANQTNYFVNKAPDALYHAAMMEVAAVFMRNETLRTYHEAFYIAARDNHNNEARRERRDDTQVVTNTEMNQNTLGVTGNQ